MRAHLLVAAACLAVMAFAPAPLPRPDKDDPKNLEGTWLLLRYDHGTTPTGLAKKVTVRIEKDKWTFLHLNPSGERPTSVYTFTLDPKKNPQWIDLTQTATGVARLLGIYRLQRDELHVAFHTFGVNDRPTGFGGTDKRVFHMVLKRGKP
jgi:uncharacterized protein (TIGR03067 family)